MNKEDVILLLKKIRSICEEGYMSDTERLDEIHRVADEAINNLE